MWVDILKRGKRGSKREEGRKENKGDELLFPLPLNGLTGRRKKMTRESERKNERKRKTMKEREKRNKFLG